MRPAGIEDRLPPWMGTAVTGDEMLVMRFLSWILPVYPGIRNKRLNALTRHDRAWLFQTFDHAPDNLKRLMITGVYLENLDRRSGRATSRPVTNSDEILKLVGVLRCLHCREVAHSMDRYPGHPLCKTCATDLEFIGLNLREAIRKLRRGEKIA